MCLLCRICRVSFGTVIKAIYIDVWLSEKINFQRRTNVILIRITDANRMYVTFIENAFTNTITLDILFN